MGYSQTRNNSKLKGHNKTRSFGVGVTLGAAILAASSFLSYAFGLLRDRLLAGQFGASMELDVYQASFLIPDLILNIFLAGALASAIVPVLSGYFAKGKNEEAFRIISFMINVVLAVIFVIAALCFAFMPFLVQITAPGFVGEKRELLIEVTRVILLSPLIFGLSNLLGGALVSLKKFLAYSLSPVLYNLGIVIGIIFLADQYGVVGVALSTIIGAFLHLSIRLISILRVGFRYHFIFKPIPKGAYKVFALMLPRIFGLLAWQGNLWAFTFFGSTLAEGSVGVFNLAR
ncbi:hypothetical protein KKC60_03595, partial [Patescibacteria group bacterium]|nr:hypothetical protein [Patescibacteria group bacterium]